MSPRRAISLRIPGGRAAAAGLVPEGAGEPMCASRCGDGSPEHRTCVVNNEAVIAAASGGGMGEPRRAGRHRLFPARGDPGTPLSPEPFSQAELILLRERGGGGRVSIANTVWSLLKRASER